jgi:KaiC/GvpD/RAD55 family RecA-like ATPase
MAIKIDIPGLDRLLPEIADGTILLVEGDIDPSKNFFAHYLARSAAAQDQRVRFITSRDKDYVRRGLMLWGDLPPHIGLAEASVWSDMFKQALDGSVLVVDSFSYLVSEMKPENLRSVMRDFRKACRENKMIAALVIDRAMLSPATLAYVAHSADAVLEFFTRETPEGLQRFLRFPKLTDGTTYDRNIYYGFDGRRISVDLRNRVL